MRSSSSAGGKQADPGSASMGDKAARGARVTLLGQGAAVSIQLGSLAVLGRILTPDDYGIYAMVVALVGVAQVVADFGLAMAAVQAETLSRQQRTNLFWTSSLLGLVLTTAAVLAAQPISSFYGRPELVDVTRVVAVAFILTALGTQFRAELSRRLRFRAMVVADVTAQLCGFTLAISMALLDAGYWALVGQQLAVAVMTLIGLVLLSKWWPGLPRRSGGMRRLYTYGLNTLGVQLLNYLTSNLDTVLIGRALGAAPLGLYNRAYQLYRVPLAQLAAPMTRVAIPVLSRLQRDAHYEEYIGRAQVLLTYTFGGLFFMAAALVDPGIDVLLGPQWDDAKLIFTMLAFGGVFQSMGYVYYWVFMSRGATGVQLRYAVVGRSIMVAAIVVGLRFGAVGVAAGASVGQVVVWGLNSFCVAPHAGVDARRLRRKAWRPLTVYAFVFAVVWPLSRFVITSISAWAELAVLLPAIGLLLGCAYAASPGVRSDIRVMATFVKRARG